ncbi:MAG: polyprenyl synthetase family protein [Candidatus Sumerlaeaceae bacterium]|nr:polyprenyl synthetase family protein [Candidatus Sumerlaeaceae bacterium]
MSRLSPELERFFSTAQQELDHVLRALIAPHEDPIPNLDDGLAYSLGLDAEAAGQGKRLRPALCLLVSHLLCGDSRPAMPFAAAIEFMHNFCLVHDDIEDGDEFRRGRPAVWKKYGLPHAINIGDYLFTKIFAALLTGLGDVSHEKLVRFFALMSATLDHTHRGQALDINARTGPMNLDRYMRLVTEKTGYYLAAPLVAGAIAADASSEIEEALNSFGMFIGPLFQIKDDMIDLTDSKGREAIGSDIREGKRSYFVAFACEHAKPEQVARLTQILDLPRAETTPELVKEAIGIFETEGAFAEARRICGELKQNALGALAPLPHKLRDALREVTEYLADRTA